jgi:polyribonucleotide nucleotidyltransferase
METALEQAHSARIHILGEMNKVISESRAEVSENAPSMGMMKVHTDKIRDVIGKGGATIRSITETTGAQVDIDDDGNIRIYGEDATSRDAAIAMIEEITAEAEIGRIYKGVVSKIVDFGAFITILPGKDGLVHISQIAQERVEKVTDFLTEKEEILVKVLKVDDRGKISLSMKDVTDEDKANFV